MTFPEANTGDVSTVESICAALYEAISFNPGDNPDFDRLRTLFAKDARVYQGTASEAPIDIETFLSRFHHNIVNTELRNAGLLQEEIGRKVEDYGRIVNIFSQYGAWCGPGEWKMAGQGVNSIQLLGSGGRWWIVTIIWDDERAVSLEFTSV